ncbi:expressed unknown protein [Ectocarpus siliculosus]|uniref:Uncharacterized protein n=1 Tax=Ectocarpus siliculosus TaxID=2880 RepID=D7G0L0_ECTSI|nr:expressed unknown protein [Ectocarpus siliculosus]|eukprot:CBJ33039.1 expressed unknown protein [Ectocarpus siliculosus]
MCCLDLGQRRTYHGLVPRTVEARAVGRKLDARRTVFSVKLRCSTNRARGEMARRAPHVTCFLRVLMFDTHAKYQI